MAKASSSMKDVIQKRKKKGKSSGQKQKEEDSKLSRLLTKYLILGSTAIISSFVFVTFYGMTSMALLMVVDSVVNSFSLSLLHFCSRGCFLFGDGCALLRIAKSAGFR